MISLLRILILLPLLSSLPRIILAQSLGCLSDLLASPDTTGLWDEFKNPAQAHDYTIDPSGSSVIINNAVYTDYSRCEESCPNGLVKFEWTNFAQQFSTWFLPWLSLLSQLPFGARLRYENAMSVLLAVGSPALAGYSLAVTVLNSQWLYRRFAHIRYPNVREAVGVLHSLQQVPISVTDIVSAGGEQDGLLASLIVLKVNDWWWKELLDGLEYVHTWTFSVVASILWFTIAYAIGIIEAFTNDDLFTAGEYGFGDAFVWLLPIVIGWLLISPKCDFGKVKKAIDRANRNVYVATSRPSKPIKTSEISKQRAISLRETASRSTFRDEESSAPIFNYARVWSWNDAVEIIAEAFQHASNNRAMNIAVNPDIVRREQHADDSTEDAGSLAMRPLNDESDRQGSIEQVEIYCSITLSRRRTQSLSQPAEPDQTGGDGLQVVYPPLTGRTLDPQRGRRLHSRVLRRILVSAILGLGLQWGTVGAGFMTQIFIPTKGLGCRSGSFLIYAVAGTIVLFLMVASSILAHLVRLNDFPPHHHLRVSSHTSKLAEFTSTLFRRLGKTLATLNTGWIVTASILQFSTVLDSCWCAADMHRGLGPYIALDFSSNSLSVMRRGWIGGFTLLVLVVILYLTVLYIKVDRSLPDFDMKSDV